MNNISEEDVFIFNRHLVTEECMNAYKALDIEDRLSEGFLALLHAIRTYKREYGCFKSYSKVVIHKTMQHVVKEHRKNERIYSLLSLDTPIQNSSCNESLTLLDCIGKEFDYSKMEVEDFISNLSSEEQDIINMRLDGFSINSVSRKLNTSVYNIKCILKNIGRQWEKCAQI